MKPERWQRIEALYDAAAEMSPEERSRFVAEQCADDDDLRREMLAAFRNESSGLTSVVEQAAAAVAEKNQNATGRRMGPYHILRPLGRGGMGAVYLATRDDDQYRKEVAIKTLKFEAEDSFALTRFRHERQILAQLEHPNIARLLDGGANAEGTPYIVMEYVAGIPITEYCQQHQLPIEHRLRLFRQVCEAVQYAHQNLIVHRDIKPANILVTTGGVPKLLDFGIAKLLVPDGDTGAEAQTATATGLRLMTPDYASPEQVRGEAITTATDIYSLGAVLYQLLAGERPHALQNYDAVEIARIVCETDVKPPSALGNRRLRGDLDTIVLKAMQNEPARRYSSVEQLSEDIRRHLDGLPVAARPDTAIYRTVKFVRRNRLGVAAVTAVIVALGVGLTVALHEAHVAERRFAQVRELANTFLFQFYDQVTPLPGSTAVRASIVDTARKYLDGLTGEAGNDKGLILELAQAYQRLGTVQSNAIGANLGQMEEARRSFQRSLDLYARVPVTPGSPPNLRRNYATALLSLLSLEYNAYHEDIAEKLGRQALDLLADLHPEPATLKLRAIAQRALADVRLRQGHAADAVASMQSALRTLVDLRSSGYSDPSLTSQIDLTELYLGHARALTGDLDGALNDYMALLRRSAPCDDQVPPGPACRTLGGRLEWTADVYAAPDRPSLHESAKAVELLRQSIHIQERIAALDKADNGARFALANLYGKLGDATWKENPQKALALYDRALALARASVSKEQFDQVWDSYLTSSSRPLIQLGRTAEARKNLAEELQRSKTDEHSLYQDRLGEVTVRAIWPDLLIAEGKRAEAREALEDLVRDTEALRAGHPEDLTVIYLLSLQYRNLASMTGGQERRQALLSSAAAWHSWPATSYTRREEQKDLAAASR